MFWLIIKYIFFIYLLVHSGSYLVKVLLRITSYFKVTYFAAAFMIMALATSVPELIIGIKSALDKAPNLSLGVVLGSNIADLALVFGVVLILTKNITLKSIVAKHEAWYMTTIAILPILLLLDKTLSRIDGVILLLAFCLFSYSVFWSKQKFHKTFSGTFKKVMPTLLNLLKDFVLFSIGIGLLLLSCKYVVDYSEQIGVKVGLPLLVIGISIIALSTSLPELVFETQAIKSGKKSMALGDLIGSIAVNSALVLGITCLIYPITILNFSGFIIASVYLLLLLVFFIFNLAKPLSSKIGYGLIVSYVVFLMLEFLIK